MFYRSEYTIRKLFVFLGFSTVSYMCFKGISSSIKIGVDYDYYQDVIFVNLFV